MIFELGHLQVFCYQTLEEWTRKQMPHEVFWVKKGETHIHGPFINAYLAVTDYSTNLVKPKPDYTDNVIKVDFKTKKRMP